MLRIGKTKVVKKEFYDRKQPIKIWDVNVNNTVISKLIELIPIWLDIEWKYQKF